MRGGPKRRIARIPTQEENDVPKPFVIFPGDRSRALSVVGEKITVLAAREDTQGYELCGIERWFRFDSDGAQMFSVTGTGSRAAAFFWQLDADVSDGDDIAGLTVVANEHGLRIGTPNE